MRRINLLSENTANKIAAGEVVERASSVVKEVVENSLDAGSDNITIEIEDSGNSLIRITDNGEGIHPDDIKTAFLPHGTSKISSLEDIYGIQSFGFRGEALPSIAAVSRVRLKSRPKEFDFGREISIEGGNIISIEDVGCNPGTEIEIRDLFYNTPARQKFLKSPQREKSIISDLVLKMALGNYRSKMTLLSDGRQVLKTYGDEEVEKTIRILYGKEVYDNIIPVENSGDIMSVYGFIGKEDIARGSRNRQSIFVNRRLIKSSLITAAVENAFKSFYPTNKFPFFTIYIEIFPEYIDPNVHPSKTEIKFVEERILFKTVFDAVHNALKNNLRDSFAIPVEEIEEPQIKEKPEEHSQLGYMDKYDSTKCENQTKFEVSPSLKSSVETHDGNSSYLKESIELSESMYGTEKPRVEEDYDYKSPKTNSCLEDDKENDSYSGCATNVAVKTPKFPKLKLVGQCFNTYIIGEYLDELYVIDQHAAHEKILFEKYRKNIAGHSVNSQILAVPAIIPLTFDEYAIYKDNEQIFKDSGFMVEDFGDSDVLVREVPLFLGKPQVSDLFHEIIDNIKGMGTGLTVDVKYNRIATIACKAAVKAHDKLTDLEINGLLEELRFIDEPFNCPHGRPTILKYELKDIEKSFKRIK